MPKVGFDLNLQDHDSIRLEKKMFMFYFGADQGSATFHIKRPIWVRFLQNKTARATKSHIFV